MTTPSSPAPATGTVPTARRRAWRMQPRRVPRPPPLPAPAVCRRSGTTGA
jgi:hypothetical protein